MPTKTMTFLTNLRIKATTYLRPYYHVTDLFQGRVGFRVYWSRTSRTFAAIGIASIRVPYSEYQTCFNKYPLVLTSIQPYEEIQDCKKGLLRR